MLMVVGIMVFLVGFVSGASLSVMPSSLDFDLVVGDESSKDDSGEPECLRFGIRSSTYDGELVSSLSGDFSGVDVLYSPEEIESFDGYESVEVCVVGNEAGSWVGNLGFETVSEDDVNVGVGVRLNVAVHLVEVEGGGSRVEGSDSGSVAVVGLEIIEEDFESVGITGGVVGVSGVKFVGVGFLVCLVFLRRKNRK